MRTFFMLYVVPCNALMSLRGAKRRGNLPEGNLFFLWHVTGAFATLKSPDKSQGNAIIRSIIADYFVPKILSPASPRPGTM